jgi:DNA repair protein RecO (recombination protein O)
MAIEWSDTGTVLGTRRLGESSVVLEVFTAEHGLSKGLVKGGASRKKRPDMQLGNRLLLEWKARLSDHLGNFTFESDRSRSLALTSSPEVLMAVQSAAEILRLFPERQSEPEMFAGFETLLDRSESSIIACNLLVRFELNALERLGFGLELGHCAATGTTDDLAYVSPRTGRAVSRDEGEPWKDKLLALPAGLDAGSSLTTPQDIVAALDLTGFFLDRWLYLPRNREMPVPRTMLVDRLRRTIPETSDAG